jgi:hypothetical protein
MLMKRRYRFIIVVIFAVIGVGIYVRLTQGIGNANSLQAPPKSSTEEQIVDTRESCMREVLQRLAHKYPGKAVLNGALFVSERSKFRPWYIGHNVHLREDKLYNGPRNLDSLGGQK